MKYSITKILAHISFLSITLLLVIGGGLAVTGKITVKLTTSQVFGLATLIFALSWLSFYSKVLECLKK